MQDNAYNIILNNEDDVMRKKLILVFGFIMIFTSNHIIFGAVPKKCIENVRQEIDKLPLRVFSKQYLLDKYKKVVLRYMRESDISLVEITNNTVFVNNKEITDEIINSLNSRLPKHNGEETIITLYKLSKLKKLPDVMFFYSKAVTRNLGKFIDKIEDLPILVGNNSRIIGSCITFIENCSLSRGQLLPEYCWENVFEETYLCIGKTQWQHKQPMLFWRGPWTDLFTNVTSDVVNGKEKELTPRLIIHVLSQNHMTLIDAGIIGFISPKKHKKRFVELLGEEEDFLKHSASIEEHMKYKYQIVLDGIQCTNPGYAWRLLSDCCVLKVDSIVFQWFYHDLKPWVHYIPIKQDLSDLVEKILWLQQHDDEAYAIAVNGQKFALEYLKVDDFFEYAKMVLEIYSEKQQQADLQAIMNN
jgi:hypothetical protein